MRRLILGTAGHIDHGKTALVRALTGVDTDRLKEEKERGITIELGFAELSLPQARFGVVDVPGHEAFVRAMVAGATGMDVVLLAVAADEGVMPQTREHLAIVQLLGVARAIVALTKCDAVDEEWLELVRADVRDALASTPYRDSEIVATSAVHGQGLDELRGALGEAAEAALERTDDDLLRLPLDRVFTIQGTGTVVTGTVWTGALSRGDQVRILPNDLEARVRALQVHASDVDVATAGNRAAVALAGEGGDRGRLERGATLVTAPEWRASWMLTARVELLPETTWSLAHNQRVRVHLGTAEVLARVALFEGRPIGPGEAGWVQLRLEEPVVARGRDRFVLRAYSPVTTIGGGVVAESSPPKRKRLDDADRTALETLLDGGSEDHLRALLRLAGWEGVERKGLPILSGLRPTEVEGALPVLEAAGALQAGARIFAADVVEEGQRMLLQRVEELHAHDPLLPAAPLAAVRTALPAWTAPELPDALIARLVGEGALERADGGVRAPGHVARLAPDQEEAVQRLESLILAGGLGPPMVDDFPEDLRSRPDLWSLLKHLESAQTLTLVADGYFVHTQTLEEAVTGLRAALGGQVDLGPSAFREVLPVTRKHLIPLLNHLDGIGVTIRREGGREVAR